MMNVLIWFLCGSRTKPSKLEKRSITVNSTAIFTSHVFICCGLSCIHSLLTGNLIFPVTYSLFFYYHIHLGLYNTIIFLCVVVFHLFWGFNYFLRFLFRTVCTVLELEEGKECVIVGTLYKHMKLKPRVLDEYSKQVPLCLYFMGIPIDIASVLLNFN